MFQRVSNKFQDNVIRRLDPVAGAPVRGLHEKADTLADAWTPILQQPKASPEGTAITACKLGKATGPDRLGNDWYRAYEPELTPILALLLDKWYAAGTFPTSFLDADIFCLKKGGDQRNALNFRPLALLNTDYKILTRILATRISRTLPERLHPNQNGFVPGRTIHETLHLFEAAQQMVMDDPEQAEAVAMLLDFKKAYDSIDRQYMLQVLRQHGYPEQFVNAIWNLHEGTQVRFIANGSRSRKVQVTSGIRQVPASTHFVHSGTGATIPAT
ncbi:hypothetical protein PF005_g11959 [Phytophthora fragariae]|uniref:Reverse transcriptase domain-containing protein n=1 Tax=Phytophthora fragariae TaxID=53985 RepID=A0A6A3Y0Q1_9STRA|nr:hypothetical protein PF005_g11959 [Phytophthora fragariae]KAE9223248.1 hypothetical protein PF002_g15024 [Phytophthora fragariae]KAE9224249.1 hypothetical protein PF004_g12270 [Phytophthora fragariae]